MKRKYTSVRTEDDFVIALKETQLNFSINLSLPAIAVREITDDKHQPRELNASSSYSSTWDIRWVFMVHLTSDVRRYQAITRTWARTYPQPIEKTAFIFFGQGVSPKQAQDQPAKHCLFHLTAQQSDDAFTATQSAYGLALRTYPFAEFFAKFDDDSYVYTRALVSQVESKRSGYMGYPMKGRGFAYASGGAGYVLSRESAKRLHECQPHDKRYEDLGVGICMSNAGIPLTDLVGLHPHHPFQMLMWNKIGHPEDRVRRSEPIEGFMNPLSYHYIDHLDMIRMHDDIYTFGFPTEKRSHSIPKILHQFWEGNPQGMPDVYMQKCKHVHSDWEHIIWNRQRIKELFPSMENAVGYLGYDGTNGHLVNQDLFDQPSAPLNLLSDILRYEVLMLFGGVYVDADSECFRPMDALIEEHKKQNQAVGFLEKNEEYLDGLIASGVICTHAYSPLTVALVSELRHADWNKPAWMSAGPLYYTQIIRQFKQKVEKHELDSALDIRVLPSKHVYPYHYSDARSDPQTDLSNTLVWKGAVMDQKWGTTKGSYHEDGWKQDHTTVDEIPISVWISDPAWKANLHNYVINVHHMGLSPLATNRPRWAVAALHPMAGMCNRIMHVLSTMAFAMATGRVLLFDWNEVPATTHENNREVIGHSKFEDLFQHPPFAYSYAQAMENFRTHKDSPRRTIVHDDTDFLKALRFSDLDTLFPESIIVIERFDWWAAPLMSNEFYSHSVFLGQSSAEVFSVLFKFLFSPLRSPGAALACDWLIQHRTMWERTTAPLNNFVACAAEHGMTNTTANVVISDKTSEDKRYPHLNFQPVGCRNGIICDQHTVESMFALSRCEHAVLTHTSTFGTCISGLWAMKDTYVVKSDGSCVKRPNVDPIEAGVLDGQPRQISTVLQLDHDSNRIPKFAFVYLMMKSSDSSIAQFIQSLAKLHQHFNKEHHYPIVLFVDEPARWQYMQFVTSIRVHLVQIDSQQWAPDDDALYPATFFLKSTPSHGGFSIQYRRMSRYSAGFLLNHPALERFDYVIKIDPDTHAYATWQNDPFMQMYLHKAKIGFWISYSDTDDVTERLWDTFSQYMAENKLTLKQPNLLLDANGKYRNTNLYGCFVGGKTSLFRSKEYAALFDYLDQTGGFLKYRWDEQKLLAFYAALYLEPSEMEYFDYISIEHQEWARNAQRLV